MAKARRLDQSLHDLIVRDWDDLIVANDNALRRPYRNFNNLEAITFHYVPKTLTAEAR